VQPLCILKVHNTPCIVTRFEAYIDAVCSRCHATADGNELLRFHSTGKVLRLAVVELPPSDPARAALSAEHLLGLELGWRSKRRQRRPLR
jgi:hypothetical protein